MDDLEDMGRVFQTAYSQNVRRNHGNQRHHDEPVVPLQLGFPGMSRVKARDDGHDCYHGHDGSHA